MRNLLIIILFFLPLSLAAKPHQVAIVIDDIGWRYTDKQALTLPGNITYSVLPQTPYGQKLARLAFQQNHDVILHIPMESTKGKRLGPGALTSEMTQADIHESLATSFKEIPFAKGINNHMGSHLTTLAKPMTWTMKYLKDNQLLFLDSVTSSKTLAKKVAQQMGVPVMTRHVFLDNHLDAEYITGQFRQLIAKAKRQNIAIAIAHPHPETVAALNKLIPTLAANDIELVPLSTLYQNYLVGEKPGLNAD